MPTFDSPDSGIYRILLVEDDDGCAVLLQTLLKRGQRDAFRIRRAATLSAALQDVAGEKTDLVLLDLGLPDSRGIDTLVRLRAAAGRVPIVVLTGVDDEELATAAVQQGAQDYIVKGQSDASSLARAIRYAIERARTQQALAEAHDLLRSAIDSIPDQIYLKDTASRFVSVNSATARFFGAASTDAVTGRSDFDFFPRELAAQFEEEERALLQRNQPCVNREAAITDSAGNTRWVLTTKVPLRNAAGNITGLLGINRDITERKAAEEALRQLNANLEQCVAERTSELRKAVARLEEDDRAKAEFVSSVSHELKTPLASMRFEIENLLEGVVGPVPGAVTEYLRMLLSDCRRMSDTVQDILDFSRLESKTMRLHRTRRPLDILVRQAAATLKFEAQAKRIDLVLSLVPGLGFADCDGPKVMRAIGNIIGNAIKFTPEGGTVEIKLRRDPAAPEALIVEVTDNGIGIAPQHLARVTEKYFRVGEHVSGAGLGLSIAKEIVELHGGQLAVQSPPPARARGTSVSVRMPAAPPPTVLLCTGDGTTRRALEQQLNRHGYRVIACGDGEEALLISQRSKPDIGIFDESAPGSGGKELALRMKAEPSLQGVAILAAARSLAGPARSEDLDAMEIPVVPIPCGEEDLLDRIQAAVNAHAAAAMCAAKSQAS